MSVDLLASVIEALTTELRKGDDNFAFGKEQASPYNLHDDPHTVVIPPYNDGYIALSSVIIRWSEFYSVMNSYGDCRKFDDRAEALAFALKV